MFEEKNIKNWLCVFKKKINLDFDKLQLKKEDIWRVVCDLSDKQKKQLEEWTGLKCSGIVFDSNIDDWNTNTSEFNERIIGKKQLIFLIEDEDGEKFGYYLNTKMIERYYWNETDNKSFEFNLQSNGRLQNPMKFEIKHLEWGGYMLFEKTSVGFISLGDIYLKKENKKNKSHYWHREENFNYHGIENALCRKTGLLSDDEFMPKRILIIQME